MNRSSQSQPAPWGEGAISRVLTAKRTVRACGSPPQSRPRRSGKRSTGKRSTQRARAWSRSIVGAGAGGVAERELQPRSRPGSHFALQPQPAGMRLGDFLRDLEAQTRTVAIPDATLPEPIEDVGQLGFVHSRPAVAHADPTREEGAPRTRPAPDRSRARVPGTRHGGRGGCCPARSGIRAATKSDAHTDTGARRAVRPQARRHG